MTTKGYLWAVVDSGLMGQPIDFDGICLLPTSSIPTVKEMIEANFENEDFLMVVEEVVRGSNCIVDSGNVYMIDGILYVKGLSATFSEEVSI